MVDFLMLCLIVFGIIFISIGIATVIAVKAGLLPSVTLDDFKFWKKK